ncbi:MAG: nitrogen regulation protein NR(I) [Wenzhouxiangellaceae bacterium]
MSQVWVLDDDQGVRFVVDRALTRAGHQVRSFSELREVRNALAEAAPDVLITDIRLDDGNGLELLEELEQRQQRLPVIVMTAYGNLDNAVAAYQGGAFEYLAKPFDLDALQEAVKRALVSDHEENGQPNSSDQDMIGQSAAMQELFRTIGRLSTTGVNVLICGETGTGKELVARALHRHSPRAREPFVAINSAAVPAELLESELFGHEKGAFTGAVQRYQGRFEQAAGGTLFLDEIGDMPSPLQARLLRVLAEGDYYRVGGRDLLKADVRIIAASHQDLPQLVAQQRFRADLYHRLNVVQIQIPPLRQRRDDIPLLANHFLNQCAAELGLESKRLADQAMDLLRVAAWPGNVRELKNTCQHLLVMAPGEVILPGDLPAWLQHPESPPGETVTRLRDWRQGLHQSALESASSGQNGALTAMREETRRVLIDAALHSADGRLIEAARLLGIGRNTLSRWLKESAATKK